MDQFTHSNESNKTLVISQPNAGVQATPGPQRVRTWSDIIDNLPGKAWHDAAERLTDWTNDRIVNRTDVYRAYKTMDHRFPGRLLTYTAPWFEEARDFGSLRRAIVIEHYRGDQEKLIELHAISIDNESRWFVIDIDQHGGRPVLAEANLKAALGWYEDLQTLGFRPLLMDADGAGGYQLLVCLSEEVPSKTVYEFVTEVVQNFADYGLRQAPRVIPAEPEVNPHRPYGSSWRLPGRHHTNEHWTKVWDGSRWLEDEEAIEAILSIEGDPPHLIPGYLGVPAGAERLHGGGFLQLAELLLKEGFEPLAVEELAIRWDATQYQPPRNDEHLRQMVRDLVQEELKL
jgi:hypothetical protein